MSSSWGLSWGKSWGNSWGMLSPTPPTPPIQRGGGWGWNLFPPKKGRRYILKVYGDRYEVETIDELEQIVEKISEERPTPKVADAPPIVVKVVDPGISRLEIHKIQLQVERTVRNAIRQLREQDDEEAIMVLL